MVCCKQREVGTDPNASECTFNNAGVHGTERDLDTRDFPKVCAHDSHMGTLTVPELQGSKDTIYRLGYRGEQSDIGALPHG